MVRATLAASTPPSRNTVKSHYYDSDSVFVVPLSFLYMYKHLHEEHMHMNIYIDI